MLNINGLTVRLGGRTILDRASAAIPPGAHVGLIGRNGAGKSTMMKAVIGLIDPDEGSVEMPRRTRLGYIAQEAPSGTASPFETVLAADVERARLMEEAETWTDPHRLGDIHDRLLAIDAYTAPARAARILLGLGFDEEMQSRPLDSYSGGWKMRVALAAQIAAARAAQDAQRARLQDYIARNSARASTAKQAQSRAKMLAKMQPIAALAEDPSLSFDFPSPSQLKPPLITLDMAAVGYNDTPVLSRLNMRVDPDDRIALLGRNGNGKTTLARLLAAQLHPMAGGLTFSGKMRVGYFTQYQVEELHGDDTPLQHMSRAMEGQTPGAVRAQLGRFGFSGDKATTAARKLSGGEKARLALALITRDAPHLLILDEPTNHLDVDAREALVQALNDYDGAVILISHDRHMVELTADRLVLVDDGTAREYAGSIEDYIDFVLGRNQPKQDKAGKKKDPPSRDEARKVKQQVQDAERKLARVQARIAEIDAAMLDAGSAHEQLGRERTTLAQ